jgi:hypothetical protein
MYSAPGRGTYGAGISPPPPGGDRGTRSHRGAKVRRPRKSKTSPLQLQTAPATGRAGLLARGPELIGSPVPPPRRAPAPAQSQCSTAPTPSKKPTGFSKSRCVAPGRGGGGGVAGLAHPRYAHIVRRAPGGASRFGHWPLVGCHSGSILDRAAHFLDRAAALLAIRQECLNLQPIRSNGIASMLPASVSLPT